MAKLLVVGGVSLDTLHLPRGVVITPGGAGLYTALAARNTGASVELFAQRPDPMPDFFHPIASQLDWIGPKIPFDQLPRLEIIHYGGGKAELLSARWGAQSNVIPSMLPKKLKNYSNIHITVMSSPIKQLEFLRYFRSHGKFFISAGTNGQNAHVLTNVVMEIYNEADAFFMNENECAGLFGSLDNVPAQKDNKTFVTMGAKGVQVYEKNRAFHINAPVVEEIDPTGAGDTFCGTTIGYLMAGKNTNEAVLNGIEAASKMIEGVGPVKILRNG